MPGEVTPRDIVQKQLLPGNKHSAERAKQLLRKMAAEGAGSVVRGFRKPFVFKKNANLERFMEKL